MWVGRGNSIVEMQELAGSAFQCLLHLTEHCMNLGFLSGLKKKSCWCWEEERPCSSCPSSAPSFTVVRGVALLESASETFSPSQPQSYQIRQLRNHIQTPRGVGSTYAWMILWPPRRNFLIWKMWMRGYLSEWLMSNNQKSKHQVHIGLWTK